MYGKQISVAYHLALFCFFCFCFFLFPISICLNCLLLLFWPLYIYPWHDMETRHSQSVVWSSKSWNVFCCEVVMRHNTNKQCQFSLRYFATLFAICSSFLSDSRAFCTFFFNFSSSFRSVQNHFECVALSIICKSRSNVLQHHQFSIAVFV